MRKLIILLVVCLFLFPALEAKKKAPASAKSPMDAKTFSGLKFRNIGPALTSGRISDFAVNPNDPREFYVGVAAGNVWKTTNGGTTWKPVFDKYGSWSIADVEIDPNNTNVVWVGTGEYNSQRAIGYGDGIYRSEDGGKTWKNMGLKKTEHIGRIVIDPRNSHIYVAAQGPLWGPGGERGLYKSTDDGKTWKAILTISENTGINDVVMDSRNPDILYAAAYQRRRRVFTLINGGPESAIYKSGDAGKTWEKLTNGLPKGYVGRIGLTISPANPDVVYAVIEAEPKFKGFYRTDNRGASWTKQSDYITSSPQYYQRIMADPRDPDKVYALETVSRVTLDGGKTWTRLSTKSRHVDDHALWIDPKDTRHLIIGGDGGIYESFDDGKNWQYFGNLPVTQFYRVSVDDSKPFYFVYGGTQDNSSLGGPSQTTRRWGILNQDWFVTNGGDGFESQIEPGNPDIVYAQSQHGYVVRYDKKSGESLSVKPLEEKGETLQWNWNSPLIISPHSPTRLYFAANKLFRSDDRGNTWKRISPDLTRQLDRNKLKVMGIIQPPDVPSKNASTSFYGSIVALDESPLKEGLLYVGTDDGLIQVSEDGGENWRKIDKVPGVPHMTYVCFLLASQHHADTVYAAFDRRKDNDLKPYLMKSTDRGKTWKSIASGLPARGTVYTIAQDHVRKELMFIGTEFGVYFTVDGGAKWVQLKGGLPTTQGRDLAIQRRENDLVVATFGRGFYILDNYAPLREITSQVLGKKFHLFSVKDANIFIKTWGGYGGGDDFFKAPNPEFGATFTYYLKESVKTLKEKRRAAEKEAIKKGVDIRYPTKEEFKAEDIETKPFLLFTITDETGQVVNRVKSSASAGIHRVTWDLRYPDIRVSESSTSRRRSRGVLVMPGKYNVSVSLFAGGKFTTLEGAQAFNVVPLSITTLPAKDRKAMAAFQVKVAELGRAVYGAYKLAGELEEKIKTIKKALFQAPDAKPELLKQAEDIQNKLRKIQVALQGDSSLSKRYYSQPPSIYSRISSCMRIHSSSTSDITTTMKEQYNLAGELFEPVLQQLKQVVEVDLKKLEAGMEQAKAPWTPGRVPVWKK